MATIRTEDYINEGYHDSPARSQEAGNFEYLYRGYNLSVNPPIGNRDSTIYGDPMILGGANISALDPKAWRGAESITILNSIVGGEISPKVGSGNISVKGGATISVLDQQIYEGDPTNSLYNYAYNTGSLTTFGSGIWELPKVNESLVIDSAGKGGVVLGSGASCALNKVWIRSIWVSPSELTAGFFWGKGYGTASTCQAAIASDGTNIYRVIGGTVKNVGLVSTYLATNKHVLLTLINFNDNGTYKDAFAVNGTIVSALASTSRGSFTTTLPETIGGIFSINDDTSALISPAVGNYRLLNRWGEDHWYQILRLDDMVMGSYVNYTSSILCTVEGDSIANGFNGDVEDRQAGFAFVLRDRLQAKGYDVLVACVGTSGSAFSQKVPSDFQYPADVDPTYAVNPLGDNALKWCKSWLTDILIVNSGTNELANITESAQPYPSNKILRHLQMIHKCCAQHGVPFIHNTCAIANKFNPSTNYDRYLTKYVRNDICLRSNTGVDWSYQFSSTTTNDPDTNLVFDAAHPSKMGMKLIASMYMPYVAGYCYSSRALYPETV